MQKYIMILILFLTYQYIDIYWLPIDFKIIIFCVFSFGSFNRGAKWTKMKLQPKFTVFVFNQPLKESLLKTGYFFHSCSTNPLNIIFCFPTFSSVQNTCNPYSEEQTSWRDDWIHQICGVNWKCYYRKWLTD